ncbi:hypothetical protein GJAV_G00256270 [Gymnothorax javanicus]|nr:hypothetical protein GJAV_G00256270 [Gymnothorax javanicus]
MFMGRFRLKETEPQALTKRKIRGEDHLQQGFILPTQTWSSAETGLFIQLSTIMKTTSSVLFLILAITCTVNSQYQKFMNQHYAHGMTVRDCNRRMTSINTNYNGNNCKPVNTFITGPNKAAVRSVCRQAGRPYFMPGFNFDYNA